MTNTQPSFAKRLGLALRLLFSPAMAQQLVRGQALPAPNKQNATPLASDPPVTQADASGLSRSEQGALQLLILLQREARLVDFVSEDISHFADAEVGAAARAVHEGCQKVFSRYLQVKPLRDEAEGSPLRVEAGFDPQRLSLSGALQGEPPYQGQLVHPGWALQKISLPERQASASALQVIAPAEVEL